MLSGLASRCRHLSSSAVLGRRLPPGIPESAPAGNWLKQESSLRQSAAQTERIARAEETELRRPELADEVHRLSTAAQDYLRAKDGDLRARFGEAVVSKLHFALSNPKPSLELERREGRPRPLRRLRVPLAEAQEEPTALTLSTKRGSYAERRRRALGDRGFFVEAGAFRDAYVKGTAAAIPDRPLIARADRELLSQPDERTPRLPATASPRTLAKLGYTVANLGFDGVGRERGSERYPSWTRYIQFTEDQTGGIETVTPDQWWSKMYGKADPSLPLSEQKCRGCGAEFQSRISSLPGFLPGEIFREALKAGFQEQLCRRCYLLKHHDFLLNVNVAPVDYQRLMGHLRSIHEALIILVVDMAELPGSVVPELGSLVGKGKALIVLGNKVDLLPPDLDEEQRHLTRYWKALEQTVEMHNLNQDFNLLYTGLISAKTGFGVESLVSEVLSQWGDLGDVYLTGCTNTGKSTLFNRLMQSDLCKVRSADLLERATTSVWPGTTLNLLKFPILNPSGMHLEQREERLQRMRRKESAEYRYRRSIANQLQEPRFAMLQGHVGRENALVVPRNFTPSPDGYFLTPHEPRPLAKLDPDRHPAFRESNWLHDTPGLLSPDQILESLTLEELVQVVPSEMLIPRSVVLSPGDWLLVSGLARLQFLSGPSTLVGSVFASAALPLHVLKSWQLGGFLKRYSGTRVLGVPQSPKPLKLKSAQIALRATDVFKDEVIGDVVLSSVGWVGFTSTHPRATQPYNIKVYTPGGRGIFLRQPALVPGAASLKGGRQVGTPRYETLERDTFLPE